MPSAIAERIISIAPDKKALYESTLVSIRRQSTESLFWFAVKVLGYDKLEQEIHGPVADILQNKELYKMFFYEDPKGTYKSTLLRAYIIWTLLTQDANTTFLLLHKNPSNASEFLQNIRKQFETNETLRLCWGDQRTEKWNDNQINIKNRTNFISPDCNVQSCGLYNQVTSKHPNEVIMDDIETIDDLMSVAERRKTFFGVAGVMATTLNNTRVVLVGTRWAEDDYHNSIENMPGWKVLKHSMTRIDDDGIERSNYPKILADKDIEQKKRDVTSMVWEAAYQNNPRAAGENLFTPDQLKYFAPESLDTTGMEEYEYSDPAYGKSESACFAVILRYFYDRRTDIVYIFEADISRLGEMGFRKKLITRAENHPVLCHYGEDCFKQDAFYLETIERVKERSSQIGRAIKFNYRGHPQSVDKILRIRMAEQNIKERFYFRIDWQTIPMYRELIDQLTSFPNHQFLDAPDALEAVAKITKESIKFHGGNWAPRAIKKSY